MSKSKIVHRSPGGKALESSEFRQRVINHESFVREKYRNTCVDCGMKYEDCDCIETDEEEFDRYSD